MNFEIKHIIVKDIMGLKFCLVFFNKNTIILGKNNSGKTRILKILYYILNNNVIYKTSFKEIKFEQEKNKPREINNAFFNIFIYNYNVF